MKSRRYRKRKAKTKRKIRRGGTFLALELLSGIHDSFKGTIHTFTGDYPPPSSSILSQ